MLDIQTMFFCEQAADVAIWLIREFPIDEIFSMKHERIPDDMVVSIYEQFLSTELPEIESVNYIYEQCVEDRVSE